MNSGTPSEPYGDPDAAALLRQGLDCFRRGDVGGAEAALKAVLVRAPDHVQALSVLGALALQTGRTGDAVTYFGRAATLSPGAHGVHSNLGLALRDAKRAEDALASFERALAIKPDYVPAIFNRALVFEDMGRWDHALAAYSRVLAIDPSHAEAHNNRGLLLARAGDFAGALASYDRALAANPSYAEAHNNRGAALKELHRPAEALAGYDRALALKPEYAVAHYNRGLALYELKRLEDALVSYDKAISLDPTSTVAFNNRALVLRDLDRHAEALADCERSLALSPDYVEALSNRGAILQELRRPAEALASFDRALAVQPDTAVAWHNRGHALRGLARYDEAVASYDRAIAMKPDYAEANFNAGLCRLMLGDFARGWDQYEWRGFGEPARRFTATAWDGKGEIAGKIILIHAEQGLGDTIQFVRYAEMAAARGAKVVLEAPAPLKRLLSQAPGISHFVATGDALPPFDLQCRLLSLPRLFATRLETIPAKTRTLDSDPALRAKWAAMLADAPHPRVGLAWAGNPDHKNDRNRSIPLALFRNLVIPGASYVSLHRDLRPGAAEELATLPVRHFGSELTDFAETAALIDNLDLVISVDTSVAHLAGALGKPTWVLLTVEPDWRWLLARDDTPWYPSVRLYRQPQPGAWDHVIAAVGNDLRKSVPFG